MSAGDTIQFGSYPSGLGGGTYTGADYVITETDTITVTDSAIQVETAGGQVVTWLADQDEELFASLSNNGLQFETFLRDGITAEVSDDEIQAHPFVQGGLAQPDTLVDELVVRLGDQPFLDVLILV